MYNKHILRYKELDLDPRCIHEKFMDYQGAYDKHKKETTQKNKYFCLFEFFKKKKMHKINAMYMHN